MNPEPPEHVDTIVIPVIGWAIDIGLFVIGGVISFIIAWLIRVETRLSKGRDDSNKDSQKLRDEVTRDVQALRSEMAKSVQDARDALLRDIREGDDKLWGEMRRIHEDVIDGLNEHRREFGAYKDESSTYRTNTMVMMATKRDLSEAMEHLLELLDARMNIRLEAVRRARITRSDGGGS